MATSPLVILYSGDQNHNVQLQAAQTMTINTPVVFPSNMGSSGQTMVTDGNGNLSWSGLLSSGLDPSIIQQARVILSSANILALNTTPIQVVPAPGAGKFIEFISAILSVDFNTAAYTGGGAVAIYYHGQSAISNTVSAANSFNNAVSMEWAIGPSGNMGGAQSTYLNLGLDISCATGNFTQPGTAAGTGVIIVNYRIHSSL